MITIINFFKNKFFKSKVKIQENGGSTIDYKRKAFVTNYNLALKTLDLSNQAKTIIVLRFLKLVEKFEKKKKRTSFFYNLFRLTVTLGSLMVPTLVTIDDEFKERSPLFFLILGISLLVTVSNGIIESFDLVKIYHNSISTSEQLKKEGWNFIGLGGRYKKYNDHESCFRFFLDESENINHNAVLKTVISGTTTSNSGTVVDSDSFSWGIPNEIITS